MLKLLLTLTLILTACTDVQFSKEDVNNQSCSGCSTDPVIRDVHESYTTPSSNKVDIVFVVDNSKSMTFEQTQLSTRLRDFTDNITNLDWRIAITSTDVTNGGPGTVTQGRLKPFDIPGVSQSQRPLYITQATTDYATVFETNVVLGANGNSREQGVNATRYVIERNESNWMRSDAQFAAVVLSDEDECSNQSGTCMGSRNSAQGVIDRMAELYGSQKNFSFHSIVVADQACKNIQQAQRDEDNNFIAAYIGQVYLALTDLTGGIRGDICAQSRTYAQQLTEMGNLIQNYSDSVSLQCAPVEGKVDVRDLSGAPIPHTVVGNRVIFSVPVNPGTGMTLDYKCQD